MSSFEKWIEQKDEDLLTIRDRLGLLKALEKTLGEQTVAGTVRVADHAVYQLAMDSYEMLVIDLASFFKGLLDKSGPGLNQLNNYLSKLKPGKEPKGRPKTYEEQDQLDLKKITYQCRVKAFERLFPDCHSGKPSQGDIQKLKDRLDELSKCCREVRHNVHAHRYEQKKNNGTAVAHLELSEIEALFVEVQDTFNALRLLVLNSIFDYGDPSEPDETAKDLREIILHGSFNNFCLKLGIGDGTEANRWYWQLRDEFYGSPAWSEEKASWGVSEE